jgi:FKBP-type peptidyl-prolyl cis-trans isomerase
MRCAGEGGEKETTSMTRWSLAVLGVLGLAMGGCQEPTEIIPSGPPGTAYTRVPPPEEKEAEALGEPAMQAPVDPTKKKAVAGTISPPTEIGETKTTPSGVKYETLKAGNGPEVKPGQSVTVNYTGTLTDGKVFDSTHKGDKDVPVTFEIGTGKVIGGWDEGVPGMKIGERRRLTIPPELGYGAQGQGSSIPPNATLIFEIEVVPPQ